MANKGPPPKKPRTIGQYVASGHWEDYWRTSISEAGEGTINVRGYSINEVIEHLSYVEIKEGVPLRVIPDALGAAYTGPEQRPLPARYKRRKTDRTQA